MGRTKPGTFPRVHTLETGSPCEPLGLAGSHLCPAPPLTVLLPVAHGSEDFCGLSRGIGSGEGAHFTEEEDSSVTTYHAVLSLACHPGWACQGSGARLQGPGLLGVVLARDGVWGLGGSGGVRFFDSSLTAEAFWPWSCGWCAICTSNRNNFLVILKAQAGVYFFQSPSCPLTNSVLSLCSE